MSCRLKEEGRQVANPISKTGVKQLMQNTSVLLKPIHKSKLQRLSSPLIRKFASKSLASLPAFTGAQVSKYESSLTIT